MTIDDEVDNILEHFGVKGMRWGVRKEQIKRKVQNVDKKDLAKKTAIGVGAIAVAVGAAYLTKSMQQNGSSSVSSLSSSTVINGKKMTDAVLGEPVNVIHAARGHSKGFTFLGKGDGSSSLREYERAGFDREVGSMFRRYGDSNEKIAARFMDPEGRVDRAGRPIFHEVIVPASMSNNVRSLQDVRDKVWPIVKDDYVGLYNADRDEGR